MIEPMIEPIFVILGILASVAIPRLAATREDAEISAAVANLRTLVSDAGAYYTVQGTFGSAGTAAKWNAITNVSLVNAGGAAINAATTNAAVTAYLKVGDRGCIGVNLVNKAGAGTNTTPAYIKFTPNNQNQSGACRQVLAAAPVTAYINSRVPNGTNPSQPIQNAIAIGSNTSVY